MNLCILIAFQVANQVRLFVSIKSNKTERAHGYAIFAVVLLSLISLAALAYFMQLQTYTLLLEYLLAILSLAFAAVEFLITLAMFIEFKSLEKAE